ncbi:hypothetical protein [Brevibacillus sp. 179-C9.3 HS]|uniref:hypothetical protein n=1 Tax=unclassified Brevibacillus TaxID=2684853 RepID=UPI0039A23BEB
MMNDSKSFALIFDRDFDYNELIKQSEKHFGLNYRNSNYENAIAIHNNKQFVLDVTPQKMLFMFPEQLDQELYCDVVSLTRTFLKEHFKNQIIGVRHYGVSDGELDSIEGVTTFRI